MKKTISIVILFCLVSAVFAGCGSQKAEQEQISQNTMIANPWSSWDSIAEAESVTGFSFGLPEVIVDKYTVFSVRTMNNELIEVKYSYEDFEICIRKQKGEGQDISGDYNSYETCTETSDKSGAMIISHQNSSSSAMKQLISYHGYSWSLVASNGFWEDSNGDFLNKILEP